MAVLCYRLDWWGGCEYVFEDISAVIWDAGVWRAGEWHWGFDMGEGRWGELIGSSFWLREDIISFLRHGYRNM